MEVALKNPSGPSAITDATVPSRTEATKNGIADPAHTGGLRRHLAAYTTATLLCILCLIWVLRLWQADLRIPLQYWASGTDVFVQGMLTKALHDNPWYLHNQFLGAPFEQNFHDFPLTDTLHFLIEKILFFFTDSWGLVLNLHFLLGFVLTTWTALFVMRQFGISYPPAMVGSILYAFLPYHFYRGEGHLLLGAYYFIPLMVMALVWMVRDELLVLGNQRWLRPWHLTRRGGASVVICVVIGSAGTYYAFFAVVLTALAGFWNLLKHENRRDIVRQLAACAVLIAVIGGTFFVNLLPTLLFIAQRGVNPAVAIRSPLEAEVYGLRLTQLFLPIAGHRLPFLANIKANYLANAGVNESIGGSLGLAGVLGFCTLMLALLIGLPGFRHMRLLKDLGFLNLCAVLLGTVGGLGALLAWIGVSKIRSYNRITVYIAFLCLCGFAILLDLAWRRWANRLIRAACLLLFLGSVAAGVLEQTSVYDVPPYRVLQPDYLSDDEFVHRIEASTPDRAMIFQLPYLPFPEPGFERGHMRAYDQMRGYMHSHRLRWSYGAMKGRYADAWVQVVSAAPARDLVEALAVAGFSGIYVDRFGYTDSAVALETELTSLIGAPQFVSRNHRLSFFNLASFAGRFRQRFTPVQWREMRDSVMNPPMLRWAPQFSGQESAPGYTFRWCGRKGSIAIENPASHCIDLQFDLGLVAPSTEAATVRVSGPGFSGDWPANNFQVTPFSRRISVPPGLHRLGFKTNAPLVIAPADPRTLVFQVRNVRVMPANPAVRAAWSTGCSAGEPSAEKSPIWCGPSAELQIQNPTNGTREIPLEMTLVAGQAALSHVRITGLGLSEVLKVDSTGTRFDRSVIVPPGTHVIRFSSRHNQGAASKSQVFRVDQFRQENPLLAQHVLNAN